MGLRHGKRRGGREERRLCLSLCGILVLFSPSIFNVLSLESSHDHSQYTLQGLALISLLYIRALSMLDFAAEARRALNACTDQKLEQAWEATVEHEKMEREGGVEAAARVGMEHNNNGGVDRV